MQRSDILLLGCGGGGNRLVDTILNIDQRFVGFFVNSSSTDLQSLHNYDELDKNYLCISQNNGAGRNRELGKRYAMKYGFSIFDTIQKFDQKTIFLVTSLGGGTGSSTVSVLLDAIREQKLEGEFDKVINLIAILPDLKSPDIILSNAMTTWNEIMSYQAPRKGDSPEDKANFIPTINNMIFIDNNNLINNKQLSEEGINERFAELFDAIFDIPDLNGTKFDNANLGNIINSHGCTYVYDLPSGCDSVEQAIREAEQSSILARMYKPKELLRMENGEEKIQCGYLGVSFNDENYSNDDILRKYHYTRENYHGYNEDKNLILISGMLPPLVSIQTIKEEIEDRKNKSDALVSDYSQFAVGGVESAVTSVRKESSGIQQKTRNNSEKSKSLKKAMKKNLFGSMKS